MKTFNILVKKNNTKFFSILDINKNIDQYELNVHLEENAKIIINMSILSELKNKIVNVNMYHNFSSSISECYCYGISKKANISFNLNSYVKEKTFDNNCVQEIHGLLLSNDAKIAGNPNLIIDTNKIKASHKLSIGHLRKDYLFYLLSKGISEENAKILLSNLFYSRHIDNQKNESNKELIYKKVEDFFNNEL